MTSTTLARPRHSSVGVAGTRPVYAIAYERISKFKVDRDGVSASISRGVDRQAKDAEKIAERLDLGPIREHFTDNDRSASQFATKKRERWEDMLVVIRSGAVTHVLFWLVDRALRTTADMDRLLDACRAGGTLIVQTAGSSVICDPNSPDDVFRLKLAGLLAETETAKMSVRQKRTKQEAAEAGASHGGRRRFGYLKGMTGEHPVEGPAIREIVGRVIGGQSLASCVRYLEDEGIPTTSGGTWTASNLGTMLKRPALAGLRVHQKQVIGDASWDGIISIEQREALLAILDDPARRTSRSNARVYLLAGLALCDECGSVLRGRPMHGSDGRAYACATGRHCHRSVEIVDAAIEALIVTRLEDTDATGALADDDAGDEARDLRIERDDLNARLEALADDNATGDLSDAQLARRERALDRRVAIIDKRLADLAADALAPVALLEGMTGTDAAAAWADADLEKRRALIDYLCTIRLVGARTRRAAFDEETDLLIEWKRD